MYSSAGPAGLLGWFIYSTIFEHITFFQHQRILASCLAGMCQQMAGPVLAEEQQQEVNHRDPDRCRSALKPGNSCQRK